MKTHAAALLASIALVVGCGSDPGNGTAARSGSDASASDAADASSPDGASDAPFAGDTQAQTACGSEVCPVPDGFDCGGGQTCGQEALVTGTACSGTVTCSMLIDPCPGFRDHAGSERTDTYSCICEKGIWSCFQCAMGAGACASADAAAE